MEDKEKIITKNDYVLTNINIDGRFVIRLTDEKEYVVYRDKSNKYYIKKDEEKYYLDKQVRKWFNAECDIYNREGI